MLHANALVRASLPAGASPAWPARGPGISGWLLAWMARLSASHRHAVLFLIAVALLCFAPGWATTPPMDRDEPRFAQSSKQMVETGDAVSIRFQDEDRLKKPIGIYWLQAASAEIGGRLGVPEAPRTIWLYRIPSLLGAVAAVLLTYWTALPLASRRGAMLAGTLMATCVLLGIEARLAKTDAVLLATVLAMQGVLARLHQAAPDRAVGSMPAFGFWTAMAASILVKGPIGPMVVGLTALAAALVRRDARWLAGLRWRLGVPWMLLLVLPWLIAIMVATHGQFLSDSVGQDMLAKVGSGREAHGAPPGTYLALLVASFWPAGPLVVLAAGWAWRQRRRPAVAFLLAWLVPSWLVFEAVPTKLPHYVLPLCPALAILVALAADEMALARRAWARIVGLLGPLLAALLTAAALGAIWRFEHHVVAPVLACGLLALALAFLGWRRLSAGSVEGAMLSALAAVPLYWGVLGFGVAALPALWPSPRLVAAAARPACPSPAFASVGYHEPSLVFLLPGPLSLPDDGEAAATFLKGGPCRTAFVDFRDEPEFRARLAADGTAATAAARVGGINLNGGRRLDIGVWQTAP